MIGNSLPLKGRARVGVIQKIISQPHIVSQVRIGSGKEMSWGKIAFTVQ